MEVNTNAKLWTETEIDNIWQRYKNGEAYADIAEVYGKSVGSIKGVIRRRKEKEAKLSSFDNQPGVEMTVADEITDVAGIAEEADIETKEMDTAAVMNTAAVIDAAAVTNTTAVDVVIEEDAMDTAEESDDAENNDAEYTDEESHSSVTAHIRTAGGRPRFKQAGRFYTGMKYRMRKSWKKR